MDPNRYFKNPSTAGQKQYEALRAFFIDNQSGMTVARRFGYTYAAFNSLRQKFKAEEIKFFVTAPTGPKGPRMPQETIDKIIDYRKKGLSAYQIAEVLETFGEMTSVRSVARVLEEHGFPKLPRRTQLKIGLTKDNTITPEYAAPLDMSDINGLKIQCAVGGIFLFAPMLERFKIPQLVAQSNLPRSPKIPAFSYIMSMLCLKLVDKERLSQINDFNFDRGFGLFSGGLNVMPKSTAVSTYSYRLHQRHISKFMKGFVETQNANNAYGSGTINLDFHTIQHYGEESILEEHWSGSRSKRVKGALTFIAQDCDSRCQLYVNADIHKKDADNEILAFVKFWRSIRGKFRQTLVFDSKVTTYEKLRAIADDGVTFITLRRRGKKLVKQALELPTDEWQRIKIDSPKRKYANPLIHDSMVQLEDYGRIRQIVMVDNGREDPAFFITNNFKAKAKEIVEQYAKRWNIENGIDEAVSFFHLNALSSPILIKIHFDVVLTMIADTLYYHLAQDLRGFEGCEARKIFRNFINMPAKIEVKSEEVLVRYPLMAHSPVLRSAKLDRMCPPISWLGNRKLRFVWGDKF